VLRTPTLSLPQMLGLLEEAEDVFETEFDARPPPALDQPPAGGLERTLKVDLDRDANPPLPVRAAQAFTLWLTTRDAYRSLPRAERKIRELLSQSPFTTLQLVLETAGEFPFDVFQRLKTACARDVNVYLDRFHEFTPGRKTGAQRIVALLPAGDRAQMDPEWVADALAHTDIVWAHGEDIPRELIALDRDGEWHWSAAQMAADPARALPQCSSDLK